MQTLAAVLRRPQSICNECSQTGSHTMFTGQMKAERLPGSQTRKIRRISLLCTSHGCHGGNAGAGLRNVGGKAAPRWFKDKLLTHSCTFNIVPIEAINIYHATA